MKKYKLQKLFKLFCLLFYHNCLSNLSNITKLTETFVGPLAIMVNNITTVIGVVSKSLGCMDNNTPGKITHL